MNWLFKTLLILFLTASQAFGTTLYCDLAAGNDGSDALSFANRAKTLTTGIAASDTAPGDTVRIMASPEPTSIGNATWTRKTKTADLTTIAPSRTVSAMTNAAPPVITTSVAHGFSNGDLVHVSGNTNTTANSRIINGIWEVQNVGGGGTTFELKGCQAPGTTSFTTAAVRLINTRAIKLAAACNKTIDMCEVPWTASANVTASNSTTRKQGDASASIAIGTFTTGLAAYRALPATLDLSGYQQVTFWIRTNVEVPTSSMSFRLCSDAAGVTTVDTIAIPNIKAINSYVPVTVNVGSNLGSAIQSIAIYQDSDQAATTVLIDNIVSVKSAASADSLGTQSIIGKSSTGYSTTETFYPLASIEETALSLDCGTAFLGGVPVGWWGTTETVTTYKVEPIALTQVAGSNTDMGLSLNESGTAGNLITISGGWDTTDMTTQSGFTWIDCRACVGNALQGNSRTFVALDRLGLVRGNTFGVGYAMYLTSMSDCVFSNLHCCGCSSGMGIAGFRNTLSGSFFACNNGAIGIGIGHSSAASYDINVGDAIKKVNTNNGGNALLFHGSGIVVGTIGEICGSDGPSNVGSLAMNNNGDLNIQTISKLNDNAYAIGSGVPAIGPAWIGEITECNNHITMLNLGYVNNPNLRINKLGASTNTTILSSVFAGLGGSVYVRQFTNTGAGTVNGWTVAGGSKLFVSNYNDGSAYEGKIYAPGCNITTDTTTRHTASGVSYKFSPISTTLVTANMPVIIPIAKVACTANKLCTITCYAYRTHNDTFIGIRVRKNALAGISADQSDLINDTAAWEQLNISFTPTESGAVEVEAYCYGHTTRSSYLDDMQVTRQDGNTEDITLDNNWYGMSAADIPPEEGGGPGGATFPNVLRGGPVQ